MSASASNETDATLRQAQGEALMLSLSKYESRAIDDSVSSENKSLRRGR